MKGCVVFINNAPFSKLRKNSKAPNCPAIRAIPLLIVSSSTFQLLRQNKIPQKV
jgi:hypothetical protein